MGQAPLSHYQSSAEALAKVLHPDPAQEAAMAWAGAVQRRPPLWVHLLYAEQLAWPWRASALHQDQMRWQPPGPYQPAVHPLQGPLEMALEMALGAKRTMPESGL